MTTTILKQYYCNGRVQGGEKKTYSNFLFQSFGCTLQLSLNSFVFERKTPMGYLLGLSSVII